MTAPVLSLAPADWFALFLHYLALSLLHPRSSLVRCGPDPEFCGARPVLSTRW